MEIELLTNIVSSKSWICNYLKSKEIITKEEFNILGKFGAWVLENHPHVMRAYWSYLSKLLEKYDDIETLENTKKIFKPWANETIGFIKTSQLNRAYNSFCLLVINLTEKYNKNYDLFTKDELQVYLGIKKSIENTKLTLF